MMASVTVPAPALGDDADVAVAALWHEHYRPLVRLASLLLDERGACEEVVQDAFVRLHLAWGRLRDRERAPAWLRSAVLNGARSRLRRRVVADRWQRAQEARGDGSGDPSPDGPEDGALMAERHREVIAALRTLPRRQREALALRFYLDLSEAEIAGTMGISTGSVKTHVHRGLAALATLLEEDR